MKRVRHRAAAAIKAALRLARLLLAVKTAAAATLAWLIGLQLPGELAEFALYAPLGTLIAMTPTIASSLAASVRAIVAILVGLLAAWGLILVGAHNVAAVALAIGVGTLLAGIPWFGAGRNYIPIAAVFVFLVGGSDPDGFSLALAAQFGVGAGLGVLVNLLVPPPLQSRTARAAVARLREETAECVERFVDTLHPAPDGEAFAVWLSDLDGLRAGAEAVREDLGFAWESRRANPLSWNPRTRIDGTDRTFGALQRVIRELEVVAGAVSVELGPALTNDERSDTGRFPDEIRSSVATAGRQVAHLIRDDADATPEDLEHARVAAAASLRDVHQLVTTWPTDSMRDRERVYALVFALHRILGELPLRQTSEA